MGIATKLFCILAWLTLALPAAAADSGLLLGLRGDGEDVDRYRTIWIGRSGLATSLLQGSSLVVPRAQGFWHVVIHRTRAHSWSVEMVGAAPVGASPAFATPLRCALQPGTQAVERERILFLGTDYMSVAMWRNSWCDPYHEGVDSSVRTSPLDLSEPPDLGSVMPGADALLERAAQEARREGRACYTPQNWEWAVARRPGHWALLARLRCWERHPFDGKGGPHWRVYSSDRWPGAAAPSQVIGHDRLTYGWDAIRGAAGAEARDAFESPTGDLVVVLLSCELVAIEPKGGGLGAPFLRVPIGCGETPVVAQWALDRNVELWAWQLRDVLKP